MKQHRIILLIILLLGMGNGYASEMDGSMASLYAQANSEYQKGNYAAAEQHYQQILSNGIDDGAVYYNLGNACFKLKQLGNAIYYWEKAQQRNPSDREARENLQFANLLVVDRIETRPDPLSVRALSFALELFSLEQQSWIVLGLFIAANLFFTLYLILKTKNSFRALIVSLILGVLFIVFGSSLAWKIYQREYRKQGIVVEQKVDIRSGPGQENVSVFTIHEGIKIRVLGSANGWYQISLPNGWNGWLPRTCIRIL